MVNDIYIGDVGVNLKYTIQGLSVGQLMAITLVEYDIINPDGTIRKVTPTRNGAVMSYSTISSDFTSKGDCHVVPHIETSFGLKKHLDAAMFVVKDPNDP